MSFRKAMVSGALIGASIRLIYGQAPPKSEGVKTPDKMLFCANRCFQLTKNGDHYDGVLEGNRENIVVSHYKVVSFTPESVVLEGWDIGGTTAILRAHMSADLQSVEGGVMELHTKDGKTGTLPFQLGWGSSLDRPLPAARNVPPIIRSPLPLKMRFCAERCFILSWLDSDQAYHAILEDGDDQETSRYTVEIFTRGKVAIWRHDWNGDSADLTGRIAPDGKSVIDGQMVFYHESRQANGTFTLTWEKQTEQPRPDVTADEKDIPPPAEMRLCVVNCFSLRRKDDGYEGFLDGGDGKPFSTYRVFRFTTKRLLISRRDADGNKAWLMATMSPKQDSAIGGEILFKINDRRGRVGRFDLTWGDALLSAKPIKDRFTDINLHLDLPPDASLRFAGYPAEVRAVLQASLPYASLYESRLSCDTTENIDKKTALEIAKSAFRGSDYEAGICWAKRSERQGNLHAKVILGIAEWLGWDGPRNPSAAFQYWREAFFGRRSDMWAAYFLQEAYQNGIGTPVDLNKAGQLMIVLGTSNVGVEVSSQVGRDDPNLRAMDERFNLLLFPPTKEATVCEDAQKTNCHQMAVEDDEELFKRLGKIKNVY